MLLRVTRRSRRVRVRHPRSELVGTALGSLSRRTGMELRISARRTPGWRVMAETQISSGPVGVM